MMWTKEKFGRLTLATTYSNFQSAYWNWLRGGEALAEAILAQQAQESDGPLGDTMAVMGQQLTDENTNLRTQLAQRDGELEALRETVLSDVIDALEAHRANAEWARGSHWAGSELWHLNDAMLTAFQTSINAVRALSDNPESPALTDKEA